MTDQPTYEHMTPDELRAEAQRREPVTDDASADTANVPTLEDRVTRIESALGDMIRYHETRGSVDPGSVNDVAA